METRDKITLDSLKNLLLQSIEENRSRENDTDFYFLNKFQETFLPVELHLHPLDIPSVNNLQIIINGGCIKGVVFSYVMRIKV